MQEAPQFLNGPESPAQFPGDESPSSEGPQTIPAPLIGAEYLTLEQLARELGLSERTLARWHVQRIGRSRELLFT